MVLEDRQFDLVVVGGVFLDRKGPPAPGWLASRGGVVAALGSGLRHPPALEVVDVSGFFVLPGLVDTHVHFREPGMAYKEGFLAGSGAAAAGGVTTVFDMPNTEPPTNTAERLLVKAGLVSGRSWVDFGLYGLLGPGDTSQVSPLMSAGAMGIKTFLGQSEEGDGCPMPPSDGELLDALERLGESGGRLAVHAENHGAILHRRCALRRAGRGGIDAHEESRPAVLEAEAIMRAGLFGKHAGCPVHIVHVSSRSGVEAIARLREAGVDVSAETCPHYLVPPPGSGKLLSTRVNPPIRTESDRLALVDGLKRGVLDYIASDHAPHHPEEKTGVDVWSVRAGLSGVEHMLAILWAHRDRLGASAGDLVRWLAENPARTWRIWPRKGCLRIGSDADLVALDPHVEWELDGGAHSRHATSPYRGVRCLGRPVLTVLRGKVIARGGELVGKPAGRWLTQERSRVGSPVPCGEW